jgi:hypothetical protein
MATIDKAEIKILTAIEIGATLEDMLESSQRHENMHAGAKDVLATAYKNIGQLEETLKQEIESGAINFDELKDPNKMQALVRKFIARAMNIVDNMKVNSQNAQIGAAGMVAAYKSAMGVSKKVMDVERGKMEAVKAALEQQLAGQGEEDLDLTGRPAARVVGMHPGDPLADRRAPAPAPVKSPGKKSNGRGKGRGANTR